LDLARRAAPSNIPILFEGESGVGKGMAARAVQGLEQAGRKTFCGGKLRRHSGETG